MGKHGKHPQQPLPGVQYERTGLQPFPPSPSSAGAVWPAGWSRNKLPSAGNDPAWMFDGETESPLSYRPKQNFQGLKGQGTSSHFCCRPAHPHTSLTHCPNLHPEDKTLQWGFISFPPGKRETASINPEKTISGTWSHSLWNKRGHLHIKTLLLSCCHRHVSVLINAASYFMDTLWLWAVLSGLFFFFFTLKQTWNQRPWQKINLSPQCLASLSGAT